ncbi:MAG: hypothetical protein ACLUNZ_06240 [Evtepia sp.]
MREDNRLTHTQAGKLSPGPCRRRITSTGEQLDAAPEFLQRAGVPAEREPGEILHHIWGKFMLERGREPESAWPAAVPHGQVQKPG